MHIQGRRRGFSLVELMVVVGIVGVLGSLAMPRYNSFIANARRGEANRHLHIIHTLQESYKAEHGGYYSGLTVGYFMGGSSGCEDVDDSDDNLDNKLGFRPNTCATATLLQAGRVRPLRRLTLMDAGFTPTAPVAALPSVAMYRVMQCVWQ